MCRRELKAPISPFLYQVVQGVSSVLGVFDALGARFWLEISCSVGIPDSPYDVRATCEFVGGWAHEDKTKLKLVKTTAGFRRFMRTPFAWFLFIFIIMNYYLMNLNFIVANSTLGKEHSITMSEKQDEGRGFWGGGF